MAEPRRIAVLTTGRQDYGILRSSLLLLRDDPRFALRVWAGGMHLQPGFGYTVERIRDDGLPVDAELAFLDESPKSSGDPAGEAARALAQVAAALDRDRPDALVLLGDRSETIAAGLAATLAGVPIVHLHGGEESEGAVDNALRHALTKLSHLHLVSHERHAARVRQMGEPADTVVVVGAAGLDNLYRADLPDRAALEERLGVPMAPPLVLVTLHPTTLGGDAAAEVTEVSAAMERVEATWLITLPNSDAGGEAIRAHWHRWAEGRARVRVVEALGEAGYWGALRIASAVLGNSSSGLVEAPAAGLPVVNVGDRQKGRLRSEHVTDAPAERRAIAAALLEALSPSTRARLAEVPALYPGGAAAPRIVEAMASWNLPRPPRKRFADLPAARS